MDPLQELYQELILDHHRHPRNYVELPHADRIARGNNPLCGDELTIYLNMKNDVIERVAFQGHGCAIATASASLLTEQLAGKTTAEALAFFSAMHTLLTTAELPSGIRLGKLEVLKGVCQFPVRVKCASLAWHTLRAALLQTQETASTE
jgi:nitrogen fixation NifU-like protein